MMQERVNGLRVVRGLGDLRILAGLDPLYVSLLRVVCGDLGLVTAGVDDAIRQLRLRAPSNADERALMVTINERRDRVPW